eukprot:1839194-Rhodomonas_salina.1
MAEIGRHVPLMLGSRLVTSPLERGHIPPHRVTTSPSSEITPSLLCGHVPLCVITRPWSRPPSRLITSSSKLITSPLTPSHTPRYETASIPGTSCNCIWQSNTSNFIAGANCTEAVRYCI